MANDSPVGAAARAFANTINAGVNAATMGMFNRGIGALMGANAQQVDAANASMRANAGTMGNIATGLGNVFGAGKLMRGAGAAVGAVKAAPIAMAARAVPTAGPVAAARFLVGKAGPGLVPVVEGGLNLTKGQIAKAAGAAALFGAPMIAGMDNSVSTPAKSTPSAAKAVDQAMAQGRAAAPAVTPYDQQLAALSTILHSPNMTLGDLKAVTTMLPKPNKPYSVKDIITGTANDQSQKMLEQSLQAAAAKSDPTEAAAARDKAYQDDFLRKVAILGSNPVNAAQAPMFVPEEEVQ